MLHRISGGRLSTVETSRCSVHEFIAIRGEVDHREQGCRKNATNDHDPNEPWIWIRT
jgi:hypothetical protein